jgi:5'-nucleotidase
MRQFSILLTNDDGVQSPGIWAAAEALAELGEVTVAAPRHQYSGAGRSLLSTSDGVIQALEFKNNGKTWQAYAIGGTPAQAVLHATLEILPDKPDLLVSGINFGENIGSGITISGTVGAALEGAAMGIPSLAVSLETDPAHHYQHSDQVNFSTAAFFTRLFARLILKNNLPADVDVLKVDIPDDATPQTPWKVTRVSRGRYFEPLRPERFSWDSPTQVGYRLDASAGLDEPGTDSHALRVLRQVSVSPLSIDLTSRLDLGQFQQQLTCELDCREESGS